MNDIAALQAFLLSMAAGLSTAAGSLIALLAKKTNTKLLTFSLGFSAGVMLFISFADLLPQAILSFEPSQGILSARLLTVSCFLFGILLSAVVDRIVPKCENPHEPRCPEDLNLQKSRKLLMRTGIISLIALTVHNFPEGIATFIAGCADIRLGIPIAVAVAFHNIPEGIAISVPIYYATGSRKKAFMYSALSGLSEPLGAITAYLLLAPFMSDSLLAGIFAAVAGIMIYISFVELIPAANRYRRAFCSFFGILAGIVLMWLVDRLF